MTSVYLASPLAYALPGRIFQRRTLIPALVANDLDVRDPWHDDDGRLDAALGSHGEHGGRAYAALAASMAARNAELLRGSDAVLAVLDGAAPDAGVATEVGAASALGIPVVGWRSDIRAGAHVIPAALRHAIETSGGSLHATLGDSVGALVALSARLR